MTTQAGMPIADNQNSLKAGARGPVLLEDHALREKITHFDHERIPERVVHARGSAAHGTFQAYRDHSDLTRASFLRDATKKTPVFVRFSTVLGGAGSVDLPRDVRGFAVKFYTDEGNFDLVGNNIPVFFIQDAIKFPDLLHAAKKEPDRGFPEAASAHDTFWDFVSLMPESMHMLQWAMSDRAIPRSLRMIEGFGVHTFRLVNAEGASTFVKFHWRPVLGAHSVLWNEAVKINGADNDFHRRDLWDAIDKGDYPAWELSVQAFDEDTAEKLDFDVLDATKLIPEEVVPLTPLGLMTLDRNPDNFFDETEQVAFHPGNLVPGIDVTNDPLLQGRLFSYVDTQLTRLGGPNFNELPINKPKGCPFMHGNNHQRDGHMQAAVHRGRVSYEPSSLDPGGPRGNIDKGYKTHPATQTATDAPRLRVRPASFADHYSQARLFFRSMSANEQQHIISAFAFELGKVETVAIRTRMLGHLAIVDDALVDGVEALLGMEGERDTITPAVPPQDLAASPTLSLIKKAAPSVAGKKLGLLLGDGFDDAVVDALIDTLMAEGCRTELIAPRVGGVTSAAGVKRPVHHAIDAAPSVLFDVVALLAGAKAVPALADHPSVGDFVRDAHRHLKAIGHDANTLKLVTGAGLAVDDAVVDVTGKGGVGRFVAASKQGKHWPREKH
ncbi:MAG TPA: catalase [Myxococcota bacterium]